MSHEIKTKRAFRRVSRRGSSVEIYNSAAVFKMLILF